MMSIRIGFLLCVAMCLSIAGGPALADHCNADADVKSFWVDEGTDLKANVHVKINSARPGSQVQVYVKANFDFSTSDGTPLAQERTQDVLIQTSQTSAQDLEMDIVPANCAKDRPCTLKNVSILEVSCYEN
jgi:hypothetical protein